MSHSLPSLDQVQIAAPCSASWEAMGGDDRRRFCRECGLHVYNISALTADEAEALLRAHEGQLCVRLYRRADGTVLTQDCPMGLRALRRAARKGWGTLTAVLAASVLLLLGVTATLRSERQLGSGKSWLRRVEPFASLLDWLAPPPPPVLMGKICPPPSEPMAPLNP